MRGEGGRVTYAAPTGGRLRRAPTQRADRWSRIGQTEEFIDRTHARAHDPAVVGRDDETGRRTMSSGCRRTGGARTHDRQAGDQGADRHGSDSDSEANADSPAESDGKT